MTESEFERAYEGEISLLKMLEGEWVIRSKDFHKTMNKFHFHSI